MEDWTSGYVAGINYTYGFYREMTPALLSLVSLLKGQFAPDVSGPLTYCELGCGQGLTANILAAANPNIQFYATDFNPAQIAGARKLAAEADLGNVHFYDDSFADFANRSDLPESFDIITLHGIYSWINAENRAVIVDFIRRKLKAGGLVYMSYNALPGWAPMMPLRRLFIDHAATTTGPMAPRIDAALAFAERVMMAQARYFMNNPPVVARFDIVKNGSRNYLAHEYFNRDLTPFHAADVFEDLSQAKLSFLGSMHLTDHVDSVNLTAEQKQLMQEITDPAQRETIRDFMTNQQFRRDLFHKGSVAMTVNASREAWLNQRFALLVPRQLVTMKTKGALGEADLHANVYEPIFDVLASGPKTMREIIKSESISVDEWMKMIEALIVLVGSGQVEPCLPAKDENKRARTARAFNQAVIARSRDSADLGFLCSPVTGGGIGATQFQQLFLLALHNGHKTPEGWADFAWNILRAQNRAIIKDGATLQTPEENLAELRSQATEFGEKRLPLLKMLQVA